MTDFHHKQIMVPLLACQTVLACSKVHKCTPYFVSMLQIHFRKCLSHMRFAFSNASRWAYCSRENNLPTSLLSCHSLTGMISVHKNLHCKQESRWIWNVGRNFLLQLYSWSWVDGLCPILFLERVHINLWNCWVGYKFQVHVIFQISKHMKDLFQISLAWQR